MPLGSSCLGKYSFTQRQNISVNLFEIRHWPLTWNHHRWIPSIFLTPSEFSRWKWFRVRLSSSCVWFHRYKYASVKSVIKTSNFRTLSVKIAFKFIFQILIDRTRRSQQLPIYDAAGGLNFYVTFFLVHSWMIFNWSSSFSDFINSVSWWKMRFGDGTLKIHEWCN